MASQKPSQNSFANFKFENYASPSEKCDLGEDALKLSLKSGNLLLTEYIVRKLIGTNNTLEVLDEATTESNIKNGNILHALTRLPFQVQRFKHIL